MKEENHWLCREATLLNDDDDDADTKQPRPKVAPAQAKPRLKGINGKRLGAVDYSLLAESNKRVSDK
jgi:hypothetical protein